MGAVDSETIYIYSDPTWEALKAVCRRLPDTSISEKPNELPTQSRTQDQANLEADSAGL